MIKLGLAINPIAGMGGSVALKGTDGEKILEEAVSLGAVKTAQVKAKRTLQRMASTSEPYTIYTAGGEMGEDVCAGLALDYEVISPTKGKTTALDTREFCQACQAMDVDCLIFVGGDGTARDVLDSTGQHVPALGIPAGVKIQSSVFAVSPEAAGNILLEFLKGNVAFGQREVIDLDEAAYRKYRMASTFYGYLKVPLEKELMQNRKAPSAQSEEANRAVIAREMIRKMDERVIYLIGAGTTASQILVEMGLDGTLLGIDAVRNSRLIGKDLTLNQLMQWQDDPLNIVVSPIGGQGFLFGRGNQQLAPALLRKVGKTGIHIIATEEKIRELRGRPLLLDTGDSMVDQELAGYYPLHVGYRKTLIYPVRASN